MSSFTRGKFKSWKFEPAKSTIISYLREKMGSKPKKISEHKMVHGYFQYWLATLRYKNKADSVRFHPALTLQDRREISEIDERYRTLSMRSAFAGTAAVYATYFFGLRHRALFYIFTRKNPGIINRIARTSVKFLLLPLLIFNVSYGLSMALMKDYCHTKIKEKGLYKKYNLEYMVESKPF